MKAFILALLPGLEEENGEFFDRVLGILDRLSGTVSQAFFLQNVWLVLLTAPSARSTAIAYLSRRFPKLSEEAGALPTIHPPVFSILLISVGSQIYRWS